MITKIKQTLYILALIGLWQSAPVASANEQSREPQWVMRKNKFGIIEIMDVDAANYMDNKKSKAQQCTEHPCNVVSSTFQERADHRQGFICIPCANEPEKTALDDLRWELV